MTLKSFAYYDLTESLALPGCPVCRLLRRDVARLLDSVLYEYSTDRGMHARFRASRGLCATHGEQLIQNQNALAITVLYEQSLHEILDVINNPSLGDRVKRRMIGRLFAPNGGAALADALESAQTCIACETRASREVGLIRALAEDFPDDALKAAFRNSDGLCLEHFRQTLRLMSDAAELASMVEMQRDIWARLRAELHTFMRKSDSTYADEAMGPEADSWQRVVRRVSGEHPE